MKLLLDEMWPPSIARQLRSRGYDVVAVAERTDLRTKLDEVIFRAAQAEGRAVVTENVPDFQRLALEAFEQGTIHRGLILTGNHRFPRHDPRVPGRLINALLELLERMDDLSGIEWWLGQSPPRV